MSKPTTPKEVILGHARCSRCEGSDQEFRFEFRERGDRRRLFTVVMTAEQFAGVVTARVSEARMELCEFPPRPAPEAIK